MHRFAFLTAWLISAAPVAAEPPRVATDIAPVHSLVAQVMEGVGTPELLVEPGASSHGYALRPSEARLLSEADMIVWIGETLSPWLVDSIASLAPEAVSIELLHVAGTQVLEAGEAQGGEDEDSHEHGDDHDHGPLDPHAWLDPVNAAIWVDAIADALASADPGNAAAYRANAARARSELAELQAELVAQLDGLPGSYVTFHAAYRYFEARFGLPSHGSLSPGDATAPGPARLRALRDEVAAQGITCLFSEPQFNPRQVARLAEDLGLRTGVLDPLGGHIAPGPGQYAGTMRALADNLRACLTDAR